MKKPFSPLVTQIFVLLIITIVFFSGVSKSQVSSINLDEYICNGVSMTEAQVAEFRGISLETVQLLHTQRGLTTSEICVMPQNKLERAILRANDPMPDHPDEAFAFRKLQLQDENGSIPADGLIRAAGQIDSMRIEQGISANSAQITRASWTWLGPGNIGGRVRAIVIHPTDTNILWAGSVAGGIWKTTDGGASWQVLDDFMTNMAVSTLVIDPGNPDILYAGTGEGFYNSDGIQGAGIFKTINGGTTWSQLSATNTSNWYYVNRLAISSTGGIILAATNSGIWRSTDGGSTWSQKSFARTLDINFNPTDNTKAVASSSYGEAWYSTDGGVTWNTSSGLPVLDWLGRVEVAYAPSSTNIVYASVSANYGEVWKSTNDGASYSLVRTGDNYLGGQGWYDNIIWVDPTNANNLVVGGIDLWRSINGGVTFTKISQWWSAPNSAHADNHMIIQDPGFNGTTNKKVYFGNDGGVYRANDVYTVVGTSGWTELNNNLGVTQFYGAAGNPTTGSIVGGTQDNGTLFYTNATGTEGWTTPFGGDGGFSAYDPADANYFYGEYVNLNIHRNSSGGISGSEYISGQYWNGFAWVWKSPPYRIDDVMNGTANFIAPFILDPNNTNRILGGGYSLWRTNDAKTANTNTTGPTWASIKTSISDPISAIAVAPGNSDIVWVGHNNGNVYKTTNGTNASPTWAQVDTNSPGLPNRYVTRITVDQNDNNKVYVTFGGFSSDNVWVTTNGGTNWADITGTGSTGLPDLPVRSLVIHPINSSWLYVGTELGIFASENGGVSWGLPHDGPTNTSVDELFWMNTTLVAATHGRGLYKVNTLSPTCYPLTITNTGSGNIPVASPENSNGCSSGQYQAGEIVSLTATPAIDWTVDSWNGTSNDTSTSTSNSVTMPAGVHTVTVNYIYSPQPPTAPTNLNVSGTTSNTVTLNWQDTSNNETGFKIYLWEYDGAQWSFIFHDSVTANITAYTDINLNCASSYFYEVSAFNAVGESAHAGSVNGDTLACYAISGNVGVGEATLNYVDGFSKTVTADSLGNYSFIVESNWTGTVTPSKTGYNFSPVNRSYTNILVNQTGQNYTATLNTYLLSVSKTGTGNGTVTSSPAGINCGSTCSYAFGYNTSVILTATTSNGSTFAGWSGGGCSGIGTCTVAMTSAKSVIANFALNIYNLFLPLILR